MTELTLSLVLKALDKGATPTVRSFTAVVRGLSREVKTGAPAWVQTQKAIAKTTDETKRFNAEGQKTSRTLDELISRQRKLRFEGLQRRRGGGSAGGEGDGPGGGGRRGGGGGLLGTLLGGAVAAAGGAAVYGATYGGRRVLQESGLRQSRLRLLETLEGDAKKAEGSLKWVENFALKTPQSVDDVTAAFIRLRRNGIDPAAGNLRILGDAGVANQKDLASTIDVLLKARQGQFEQLDDYAIQAKKVGRKVQFSWEQDGKKMVVVTRRRSSEVQAALLGIFDGRYRGAMARQRGDLENLIGEAGERRDGFLGLIGSKGARATAEAELTKFLDFIDRAEKDGRLDKWATSISNSLSSMIGSLVRFGKAVDWVQLAKDMATIAGAIASVAEALEKLNRAPKSDLADKLKFLGPAGWIARKVISSNDEREDRLKAGPARAPKPFPLYSTNPFADAWPKAPASTGIRGGNRPMPGLGGGPLPSAEFKGRMQIDLAPGLVVRKADFGKGIMPDYRRGFAGDRE